MSLPQSNRPFDTRLWAIRTRPLSSDNNQQAGNDSLTLRELMRYMLGWRSALTSGNGLAAVPSGFIADAFKVDPGGGLTVALRQGIGFQDGSGDAPTNISGNQGANDLSPEKPLVLTGTESITVPTPDPSNPRWDAVFAKYSRQVNNPVSRGILNQVTGVFDPTLVDVDETFCLDGTSAVNNTSAPIDYVTGTPAGSPVKPSTPSGFVRIADVYVPAAAPYITSDQVIDQRRLLMPGSGVVRVAASFKLTQSSWTIAANSVVIDAPPGVDVVLFTKQSINSVGIQVCGPFPGLAALANTHACSVRWFGWMNVGVTPQIFFYADTFNDATVFSTQPQVLFGTATSPTSTAPSGVLNDGLAGQQFNSILSRVIPLDDTSSVITHDAFINVELSIPVV